ncbi:MAG: aminotransferase [Pseudomonadota bacterium]
MKNVRPTAEYQAMDARHHWHPFSDMRELNATGSRVIAHAKGCWLTDTDGNKILDGMAGLWNVAAGHGRREIIDAVAAQLETLSYYNTFFQCTHTAAAEFAEALCEVAPEHISHVFFTGSGSESNDTAFRLARLYWERLGKPRKKRFISRKNGYHGSTILGASLGGMSAMHSQSGLPIDGISHIEQPYWFGDGRFMGVSPEQYGIIAARRVAQEIDRLGADTVAAFIGEPIQGAGGVIIPPESYWPEVERICREREVLLVADEVITGFGRTGAWWGAQTFGFTPDLMSIAKAITSGVVPAGGVFIAESVAEVLAGAGEIFHGYTNSGHPLACAAGLANLKVFHAEHLVDRVANEIGPHLQASWARLADHPLVGEARMTGLIGALEIVADKPTLVRFDGTVAAGSLCRDICVANGLIMRAVGDTMVISPPLVISREECDMLVERAHASLDTLAQRLKSAPVDL